MNATRRIKRNRKRVIYERKCFNCRGFGHIIHNLK